MELFRVQGLSSEDLMRPGQNPTKAFLGTMFKVGKSADEQVAEDMAASVAKSTTVTEGPDGEAGDEHRWTEKDLKALNKERLIELGGSLGVADLGGTKDKLVEAILAAQ